MYILNKLPKYGWRRTGAINVLLIFTCTVILLVCLMINVFLQPTRSIKQARVIFQGDCNLASRIDIVLHLLLNIFSTCILASSNFFMQILSAPSRRELDVAHRLLLALEIGVPSIKNIFFLSPLKTVFWMGLFLSSMPIHLLLNSAVFETIYEGSDWNLTLATEAFLNGTGQYFGPGASLATSSGGFGGYFYNGDGEVVPMADYWTNTSWANMSIQQTATEAFGWEKITLEECFREYRFCNPRKQHRDLVVVIDAEGQGWNRSDVFHLDSLTSNQAQALKTLDEHVPPDVKNSLWVSGKCTSVRTYIDENNCGNDGCASALGETSGLYWTNTTELLGSTWTINFSAPAAYGLNRSSNDLNVAYCRTEANPDYQCKVGASNALLLVVILCALTKVILCTLVLWRLPQTSLVTLGDAMESYISKPDRRTFGLGTINIADSSRIENSKCTSWTSAGDLREGPRPRKWRSGPRIFKSVISKELWLRTYSLLSAGVLLLAAGLYFLSRFNPGSITSGSFGPSDSNISIEIFGMGPSYIVLLLAANCPQLILSTCYFSFNAFFTRLQTEYEWNSYSLSYKPLRVSNPSGQQVSTYRLQLPYRYSIPLLGISILLHWILSNTVFLYVVEGGFWDNFRVSPSVLDDLGVSEDAVVAVGVSGRALLSMLVISTLLCCLPYAFGHFGVPGTMVSGGSNSLVLSAACHTSVLARVRRPDRAVSMTISRENETTEQDMLLERSSDLETRRTISKLSRDDARENAPEALVRTTSMRSTMDHDPQSQDEEQQPLSTMSSEEREEYELMLLRDLTLGKVRWGAMALSPDIEDVSDLDGLQGPVLHLGFGSQEDDVQTPQEGHLYI